MAKTINIPKPPDNADLNELHKWSQDISGFLNQMLTNGNQLVFFDNDQITNMTGLGQTGKMFYNETSDSIQAAIKSGSSLVIKTFTLT